MAGYKRYHKEDTVSYALGITVTFEMLCFKTEYVNKVYVHSAMKQGDTLDKIIAMCKDAGIGIVYTDKIFNVLSQKENCYIIGEFKKFYCSLDCKRPHIVLVNPSNSGNMGTIIRTALGFGLNQIAIIRPAADIFDPKVVRSSMGALFSTDFEYFDSFGKYQEANSGRNIYPFMLNAETSLHNLRPEGNFSLVFGNEATGLPEEFADIGTPVIIPHLKGIDSLNLPVAAGIAMYEATKSGF